MKVSDLRDYYQGLIAFLGVLSTALTAIQTNEAITHTIPSNWTYGIGVGGSVLVGVLAHLKKAQPAVDDIETLVADIKAVLDAVKTPAQAVQDVAQAAPATPPVQEVAQAVTEAVAPVVNPVSAVTAVATTAATDIADEVLKVIATYQKNK